MTRALLTLAVASLTGCGAIKFHTSTTGGSDTAAAPSSPAGGTSAPASAAAPDVAAPAGDDKAAATLAIYKRLTYRDVDALARDVEGYFNDHGVPYAYQPVINGTPNPDPAWLLAWDWDVCQCAGKNEMVQAAANRTWTAEIDAEFARYWKAWQELDQRHRPRLTELAGSKAGYYARTEGLTALLAAIRKDAAAAGALQPQYGAHGATGLIRDVVVAMLAVHAELGVEMVLDGYLRANDIELRHFVESGRALADRATERDLFVLAAMKDGYGELPRLPILYPEGQRRLQVLRMPVAEPRWAELRQRRDALIAASRPAFEVAHRDSPQLLIGQLAAGDSKRYFFAAQGSDTPLVVKRLRTQRDTTVVELASTRSWTERYACKLSNRIDHIDDNGGVHYVELCKERYLDKQLELEVHFAELPGPLTLEVGDQLEFYADLVSQAANPKRNTYRLDGRLVTGVVRAGKALTW